MTRPGKTAGGHVGARQSGRARLLLLVLPLLIAATSYAKGQERRLVRVGIFQNNPIVFQDKNGAAKGIYVDMLNAIAEEENWEIRYVLDSWHGCLERLRTSDLDLMSCISYAEERDPYADFSHENVWTLWGTVFLHPESDIEDIRSMAGKKVAILKGGINGINFKKLCREFGVACDIVDLPSFDAVLAAVESREVDAGVVNSVFGAMHGAEYRVNPSSIIFSPVNTFFAVPEGKNGDLTAIVDAYLRRWKQDKKSVYHRSLGRWLLHGSESVPVIPAWILTGLSVFALVSLFLFLWTRVLRRQVNVRTVSLQKSRDELRASEERFRTIYENAPVLINAFNEDGRCLLWNEQCRKTFGWTIDEINEHGSALTLFYPDPAVCEEVIRTTTTDPDGRFREWHPVAKDGRTLTTTWANFRLPDGMAFSLGHDITQRKQAEEREKDLRDKLVRSERIESLGILAGGVAHDLNNVLGPMVVLSDLVSEDLLDLEKLNVEEAQEALGAIKTSAERAASVVKDLVSLGRRGTYNLVPMELSHIQCISPDCEVIKRLKTANPNVTFSNKLDKGPLFISGDESHLSRAVSNLVQNAAESIEKKGKVTIKTFEKSLDAPLPGYETVPGGDYAVIEVSDTGEGIDKEHLDRIFEPFYTRKKKSDKSGSGLGLSVVNGIVKDHAGIIDVKSEVGKGSVFTVYLPLVDRPKDERGKDEPEVAPVVGGTERILVVDDEPSQRFLARKSLERLGYEVAEADGGRQALARFEKAKKAGEDSPCDLVLLDMLMEIGFDGLTTYREILKLYPEQKAIISSGYADDEEAGAKAQALGVDWLTKPYHRDDLAATVRKRLERD